jgi:glycerol-3-phosphate acyltransferase PlsY
LAIAALAAIIVYQHRANMQRLVSGTENKFGARVSTS